MLNGDDDGEIITHGNKKEMMGKKKRKGRRKEVGAETTLKKICLFV